MVTSTGFGPKPAPTPRWTPGNIVFWVVSFPILAFSGSWGMLMAFADIVHSDMVDDISAATDLSITQLVGIAVGVLASNTLLLAAHSFIKKNNWRLPFLSAVCVVVVILGWVSMEINRHDRADTFFAKHQDLSLHTLEISSEPITLVSGSVLQLEAGAALDINHTIIQQFPDGASRRVSVAMRNTAAKPRVANAKLPNGQVLISLPSTGQLTLDPSGSDIQFANRRVGEVPGIASWIDQPPSYQESIPACGLLIIHEQIDGKDIYSSPGEAFRTVQVTGRHLLVLDGGKVQILQHDGLRPERIPVMTCTNN